MKPREAQDMGIVGGQELEHRHLKRPGSGKARQIARQDTGHLEKRGGDIIITHDPAKGAQRQEFSLID